MLRIGILTKRRRRSILDLDTHIPKSDDIVFDHMALFEILLARLY